MNKKQQAQHLYMAEGKTQKEIAEAVGVSERTVHTWVHQYAWNKLRLAAYQAPATIADNLCSQLVELQNDIASRAPGKRYPTSEEAEVTRKLIVSLEKMKKYPSLAQNMQVFETFRNFVRPLNKDFTIQLNTYTEQFLSGQAINGFAPYQMEYCVNPVAPYYDEPSDDDPDILENIRCKQSGDCLHKENCTYPTCKYSRPPLSRYEVPPVNYERNYSAYSEVTYNNTTDCTQIPEENLQSTEAQNSRSSNLTTSLAQETTGRKPAIPQPAAAENRPEIKPAIKAELTDNSQYLQGENWIMLPETTGRKPATI